MAKKCFFLAVLVCFGLLGPAGVRAEGAGPAARFERSYQAGETDPQGRFLGGTEILHLVAHAGRLYAGNGYWMETDIPRGQVKGAQVMVLEEAGGAWREAHQLENCGRVTALAELVFTTDGQGRALERPVRLLAAGSDTLRRFGGQAVLDVLDDATGRWTRSIAHPGGKGVRLRALAVHRDQVTGVDRVFAAIGTAGVVSGVLDPSAPGFIRWDPKPELGPVSMRPMSFARIGDRLHVSVNTAIFRREDGPGPTWTQVYATDVRATSGNGGIRGLSVVREPETGLDSLLFYILGSFRRVTPDRGYAQTIELDQNAFLDQAWGVETRRVLAAYNDMLPLVRASDGRVFHLIGFQALFGRAAGRKTNHGREAGGWFFVRDDQAAYRLVQVIDPNLDPMPDLVAVRCYALSPLAGEEGRVIYFGGFDANHKPRHNTAWIFKAGVDEVLGAAQASPSPGR